MDSYSDTQAILSQLSYTPTEFLHRKQTKKNKKHGLPSYDS